MQDRREGRLEYLEIPFLRCPKKEKVYKSILEVPDNQEAIQEMIARNPLFKEAKWKDQWLDWLHPERIEQRRLKWEEERGTIEEMRQRAIQQRAREAQAQALVQNQSAEFLERNLGQWIRQIEADERSRMESPIERRTRERRQEIQDHRRLLEGDRRFRRIVEEVRRLPNRPQRQEVFRRFWVNLYTQEYQDPLAREGAGLLASKTASLLNLEALEDEEQRETGGREVVRPLTLIREDGSEIGCRSSTDTGWCVSALEQDRDNVLTDSGGF
jgi:hypothetical protein